MARSGDRPPDGGHVPRVTIVGGRPPSGDGRGAAPKGIDHVLARAALDRRFRERLLRDRSGALDSSGIELTAAERGILLATTPEQLSAMVTGVSRNLVDRRSWFARLAGALGLFLGGATLLAEEGCRRGIDPRRMHTTGSAPDPPIPPPESSAESAPPESTPSPVAIYGLGPPKRPSEQTRGVRPDTPQPDRTRGIREDEPTQRRIQAPTGHAPDPPPPKR